MTATLVVRAAAGAIALSVALIHLGRMVRARRPLPGDVLHAGMAAAMLAMLLGLMPPSSQRWGSVAFGVGAVWWAATAVRTYVLDGADGRVLVRADAAIGCTAMAYMLGMSVPARPPGAMAGMAMSPGRWTLPVVVLLGLLVATAAATVTSRRRPATAEPVVLGCRVALDAVTAVLLTLA
ncbi:MAG: DUF5134 domain-containing protein [Jatrophihabitans sp.]|uniref:DUF5134 domain-containing protein n=1 Tax=Jatrophihabitans sp. TaxID=1932789 RepID=UPI003F7E9C49